MAYGSYGNAAYRLDGYPDLAPESSFRPDVRAVRTGGQPEQSSTPLLATAARMLAIVIVVVAALSFARIMLTSEAVTTMIESDAISGQISEARSTGVTLEMEQSVLANPSAIKAQAKKLGMAAPLTVETIDLKPDVVAVDDSGDLSLSGTVKNLVGLQG